MSESVIVRLSRDHRFPEVLSDLLGVTIRDGPTKAIRCLHPDLHKNGDAHPSMVVQPTAGGVACSCGLSLGLLGIVVDRGLAADDATAAKYLEERYYHTNRNGQPAPPREWPYFPKTAERLGWSVVEDMGAPALRCPTHAPDGSPLRTKIRRKKGDAPTATFLDDGEGIGLLGVPQFLEATESAEAPTVALLAGETDLLAWTYACLCEGIAVQGVSSANGENAELGVNAALFRGTKVIVLYDADKVGREHGPKRAAEALAAGALSAVSIHVPTEKDVCEHVLAGGTVRELLRLAAPKTEPVLHVVSLRTILDAPVEDPAWFVDGFLGRKRLTILTAAPKTGKSASAFGIALRLASGLSGTWLGSDFTASVGLRVLYLSAEGGRRLIQKRYGILAEGLPGGFEDSFMLLVERPWPRLDTKDGLDILHRTIEKHPADLLIIDPISKFRDLEDENDTAASQAFGENLRVVAEQHDLACFGVHHPSKASISDREGTSFHGGRGALSLFAEADTAISLRKDAKSGEIHAYYEMRDAEPIEPGRRLILNPDTLWLDFLGPLGAVAKGRPSTVDAASVLSAIRGCPEGHPWAQIFSLIGVGRSSWHRERGRILTELAGKIRLDGTIVFPV